MYAQGFFFFCESPRVSFPSLVIKVSTITNYSWIVSIIRIRIENKFAKSRISIIREQLKIMKWIVIVFSTFSINREWSLVLISSWLTYRDENEVIVETLPGIIWALPSVYAIHSVRHLVGSLVSARITEAVFNVWSLISERCIQG